MDLVLVGAGRVGTAVAELLRRRGHRVAGVSSRTPESASRAAQLLESPTFEPFDLPRCDLVLLGVADAAVEPVAARLSSQLGADTVVCHFAGSLGLEPLRSVVEVGAGACAMHPVQAVPDVAAGLARLPGSAWGLTCSPGVSSWAEALVTQELHGTPVQVAEAARRVWHAASVTMSNGIAALIATGESMLESIGVAEPAAVLGPLADGTVANAAERGGAAALTGPVVRGETVTVAHHLQALRSGAPDLAHSYALVAELVLAAARRAGRVDREVEHAIGVLLTAQ